MFDTINLFSMEVVMPCNTDCVPRANVRKRNGIINIEYPNSVTPVPPFDNLSSALVNRNLIKNSKFTKYFHLYQTKGILQKQKKK